MEQQPELLSPLAMQGISLSVTPERQGCILELQANPGQLAVARRIVESCQQDFGVLFEKDVVVPALVSEHIEAAPCVEKPLKIAVVYAFEVNTPSLVDTFVKENFRGDELKKNLSEKSVKHKVYKNGRKIAIKIKRINTHTFDWKKKEAYLKTVDAIVLEVNATTRVGHSLASIKELFEKTLHYFPYPEIPLLITGVRLESGKSPRQEIVDVFAESLGVPYVEYFVNRGARVTPLFNQFIDMAIYKKMLSYTFRVKCKNVGPDFFSNPDFYQRLNQKLLEGFPSPELAHSYFDPAINLYHRVSRYLEEQGNYTALLEFHLKHTKSKTVGLQKEAYAYLSQLENSLLGKIIIEKFKSELEEGTANAAQILVILNALRRFINLRIYTLSVRVESVSIKPLCDYLRYNEQLVKLTMVFKHLRSIEDAVRLGAALSVCTALKSLTFSFPNYLGLVEYEGFKVLFESHPTLESLSFREGRLGSDKVTEIVNAVSQNTVLQALNLSGNHIVGEAVRTVKYLLKNSQTLQKLDISNSQLNLSALSRVLGILPLGVSLTELNISQNQLSEVGVAYLLSGLSKNRQLAILDVSFCFCSPAVGDAFLTGLKKIDSLIALNLAGNFNHAAREWLLKILALLQTNKGLKRIDLSQNPFLDEGAECIAEFLRHNTSLTSLELSQTRMKDAGLVALSGSLHVNSTLQELIIRKNTYTLAGISTLLFALTRNTGLCSLDVGESVENKEALGSLIGFIPENIRLRQFGFMPAQKKRSVELLSLYESAIHDNKIITHTYHDFTCRCGRCLCVKAKPIVSQEEDNQLNRYKNMALLIKAYFNLAEDHLAMLVFKRIPKNILLKIFKHAYPELSPKVLRSVSHALFFKPQRNVPFVQTQNKRVGRRLPPVRLNFFGVDVELLQEGEDVVLALSSDTHDYQVFHRMAEKCRENIHSLLPYNNKCEVDKMGLEPKRQLTTECEHDDEQIFKIALMGEVGSGKTIFMNRFVHNIYHQRFKATIGIDFEKKTHVFDGAPHTVHLYDLAGTRPHDSMTHVYLRDINGILLTVDLSRPQGYEETYRRIVFESPFPNIPMVMVGLKSDVCQPEAIKRFNAIAETLNIPCMIASARAAENVDQVFELLISMIKTEKMPGNIMRLRIKKASLDWFTLPRFYGDLNQLFLEDESIYRITRQSGFRFQYYLGGVQWLRENNEQRGICRFYIKHLHNDDDVISVHARENFAKVQEKFPDYLKAMIKFFHEGLISEKWGVRHEAVEGLRALGELHTQGVKSICLRVFERIQFSSNYTLDNMVKKINDYSRSDLLQQCMNALSGVHASCFSILKEMGANQACEYIEKRVLAELDSLLRQRGVGSVKALSRK